MNFGLATEGVTDQVVLTNILYGFLNDKIEDIEEDIVILQPAFDRTTLTQIGHGSWTSLLSYLLDSRFREDVINNDYVIIQVDTDIATEVNFDVTITDNQGQGLPISTIVNNVELRLISEIDKGRAGFYQSQKDKIIFCITVHSLECWLVSYHESTHKNAIKILSCEDVLKRYITRHDPIRDKNYGKNYPYYKKLSHDFRKKKNITSSILKNESFKIFIDKLDIKFP